MAKKKKNNSDNTQKNQPQSGDHSVRDVSESLSDDRLEDGTTTSGSAALPDSGDTAKPVESFGDSPIEDDLSVKDDADIVMPNVEASIFDACDYSGMLRIEDMDDDAIAPSDDAPTKFVGNESSSGTAGAERPSTDATSQPTPGSDSLENLSGLSDWHREREVSQKIDALAAPTYGLVRQPVVRNLAIPRVSSDWREAVAIAATTPPSDTDDYRINQFLGMGGYGIVYRAEQTSLQRDVAVKVFKTDRLLLDASPATNPAENAKKRAREARNIAEFCAEANVIARLSHPNIIQIHEVGITPELPSQAEGEGGHVFYAMPIAYGRWSDLLRKTKRSFTAIEAHMDRFFQICSAVTHAHEHGIIHRDLKPHNVMFWDNKIYQQTALADWGLAVKLDQDNDLEFSAGGTARYMAPEMVGHLRACKSRLGLKVVDDLMVKPPSQWRASETNQFGAFFRKRLEKLGVVDTFLNADTDTRPELVCQVLEDYLHLPNRNLGAAERFTTIRSAIRTALQSATEKVHEQAKRISFTSDIYLLGGILWEIIFGNAPHEVPPSKEPQNPTPGSPRSHASRDAQSYRLSEKGKLQRFRSIKDPLLQTLASVAERALALDPKDRFQSVPELVAALEQYQDQLASRKLMTQAEQEFTQAREKAGYDHLFSIAEKCTEALRLWPQNKSAQNLKNEVAELYVKRAQSRYDYDAGLNFLDAYHTSLDERSTAFGQSARRRLKRGRFVRNLLRTVAIVGIPVLLSLTVALGLAAYYAGVEATKASDELANTKKEARETQETVKKQTEQASLQLEDANRKLSEANTQTSLATALSAKALADETAARRLSDNAKRITDEANIASNTARFQVLIAQQQSEQAARNAQEIAAQATEQQNLARSAFVEAQKRQREAQERQLDADAGKHRAALASRLEQLRRNELASIAAAETSEPFEAGFEARFIEAQRRLPVALNPDAPLDATPLLLTAAGSGVQPVLVARTDANNLRLARWVESRWETVVELPGIADTFQHASLSPDGKWLAIGLAKSAPNASTTGGLVRLCNIDSGEVLEPVIAARDRDGWQSVGFVQFQPSHIGVEPWALTAVVEYSFDARTTDRLALHAFVLSDDRQTLEPSSVAAVTNLGLGDSGDSTPVQYRVAWQQAPDQPNAHLLVVAVHAGKLKYRIAEYTIGTEPTAAPKLSPAPENARGSLILPGLTDDTVLDHIAIAPAASPQSIAVWGSFRQNLYRAEVPLDSNRANQIVNMSLELTIESDVRHLTIPTSNVSDLVVSDASGRISLVQRAGQRWLINRTWRGITPLATEGLMSGTLPHGVGNLAPNASEAGQLLAINAQGQLFPLDPQESGEIVRPNLTTLNNERITVATRQGQTAEPNNMAGFAVGTDLGRILLYRDEANWRGGPTAVLDAPTAPIASRTRRLDNVGWIAGHLLTYHRDGSLEVQPAGRNFADKLVSADNNDYAFRSRPVAAATQGKTPETRRFVPRLDGGQTPQADVVVVTNHPQRNRLQLWQLRLDGETPQWINSKELVLTDAELTEFAVSPGGKYLVVMQRPLTGQAGNTVKLSYASTADLLATAGQQVVLDERNLTELSSTFRRIDDFIGFAADEAYVALNSLVLPDRFDQRPKTAIRLFPLAAATGNESRDLKIFQSWSILDWNQNYGQNDDPIAFTLGKGRRYFTSVLERNKINPVADSVAGTKGRRAIQFGLTQVVLSDDGSQLQVVDSDRAIGLNQQFEDASELRRFGNALMVLDNRGVHVASEVPKNTANNDPNDWNALQFQTIAPRQIRCDDLRWQGDWVLATYSNQESVLYRWPAGQSPTEVSRWNASGEETALEFPQFSEDGRWLAAWRNQTVADGGTERTLQWFDLQAPEPKATAKILDDAAVRGVTWYRRPDGDALLVARFNPDTQLIGWQLIDPQAGQEGAPNLDDQRLSFLPTMLPASDLATTVERWFFQLAPDQTSLALLLSNEQNRSKSSLNFWALLPEKPANVDGGERLEDRWIGDPITGEFPHPELLTFSQLSIPDLPPSTRFTTVIQRGTIGQMLFLSLLGLEEVVDADTAEGVEEAELPRTLRRIRRDDLSTELPSLRAPLHVGFSSNGEQLIQVNSEQVEILDANAQKGQRDSE